MKDPIVNMPKVIIAIAPEGVFIRQTQCVTHGVTKGGETYVTYDAFHVDGKTCDTTKFRKAVQSLFDTLK